MRRHDRGLTTLIFTLLMVLSLAMATRGADPEPVASESFMRLQVAGSPLIHGRDRSRIRATLSLDRPVQDWKIQVVSYGGNRVRTFAGGRHDAGSITRRWTGRNQQDQLAPSGAYRVVATATDLDGVEQQASEWITVGERAIYPRRPGFITVAVDPGHGGAADGAVARDGTREADLNLDIGLRLARMLEGAGVNVVITRTDDSNVNEPAIDLTGDDAIDIADELAARPDLANQARADLYVSIHNNTAVNRGVGGPSTFFSDKRPFSDRSARLARIIQDAKVEALSSLLKDDDFPYDHGALIYPYYVLRGYDPPRLQRPTQMPGVLSEGLFLSNPQELRLLKRPTVRQALANAYYDAIATYLARRSSQVGYRLIEGPMDATAGEVVKYRIEVRNQGTEPLAGSELSVGAVRAPFLYEGRGRTGRLVGKRRLPRVGPGKSVELTVKVTAPSPGRDWMLLFDARDRTGKRASRSGSPPLQVPLTTLEPEPLEPSPPPLAESSAAPEPSSLPVPTEP